MLDALRYGRIRPYLRYQWDAIINDSMEMDGIICLASYAVELMFYYMFIKHETYGYVLVYGVFKIIIGMLSCITVYKNRAKRAFDIETGYYLKHSTDWDEPLWKTCCIIILLFPFWFTVIMAYCFQGVILFSQSYRLMWEDYCQWKKPETIHNEYVAAQFLKHTSLDPNFMALAKHMQWSAQETLHAYYGVSHNTSETSIYL